MKPSLLPRKAVCCPAARRHCQYIQIVPKHHLPVIGTPILEQTVEFEALTAVVMKSTNFGDITACGPLKVNRRFGITYLLLCLPPAFTLVSCTAYSSTLKIEAICSSETSVHVQRATRRYIPGESTLPETNCLNTKEVPHPLKFSRRSSEL
jgi:hypothetical protein